MFKTCLDMSDFQYAHRSLQYVSGFVVYWLRDFFSQHFVGQRIVKYIQKRKPLMYLITVSSVYFWEVSGKLHHRDVLHYAVFIPFILDCIPFPHFSGLIQKYIDVQNKCYSCSYIAHHSFMKRANARFWPNLYPKQLRGVSQIAYSFAYSWILSLQMLLLTIPLYYLQRPIEMFPMFARYCRKMFKKNWEKVVQDVIVAIVLLNIQLFLFYLLKQNKWGSFPIGSPRFWEKKVYNKMW